MIPVYRSLEEIPAGFGPSVAAIGNFDGVHLGHQQILSAVVAEARARERARRRHHLRSAPGAVSAPGAGAAAADADGRAAAAAGRGPASMRWWCCRSTRRWLTCRRGSLCEQVLVEALGVRGLHEGGNFRFGHRAEAGVKELAEFGAEFGFAVAGASRGPRAWAGGFKFGDPRAGRGGRHEARALDAGASLRGAVDAGARSRDGNAAAGADGESGAL